MMEPRDPDTPPPILVQGGALVGTHMNNLLTLHT